MMLNYVLVVTLCTDMVKMSIRIDFLLFPLGRMWWGRVVGVGKLLVGTKGTLGQPGESNHRHVSKQEVRLMSGSASSLRANVAIRHELKLFI